MTLFDFLDEYGLPWYRQGSAPQELPETFLTEWMFDRLPFMLHDDDARSVIGVYSICLYTRRPGALIILDDFCRKAKEKGFIVRTLPRDVASGVEGYYGRQIELYDIK